jgi:hypothetical protein
MAMTIHVLTTAFCNAYVFRAGMRSLRSTVNLEAFGPSARHYVLDNHYPLREAEVRNALWDYAQEPRVTIHDAGKNLGLHEGINYLLGQIAIAPDDVVVAYDADEAPQQVGWVEAMQRVMMADPKVGWLSLMAEVLKESLDHDRVPTVNVGGELVRFPNTSLMNCVVGWRGSMLAAIGPMQEPHAFYGGIEGTMQPKARSAGFRVGFMADYWTKNHRGLADKTYELYKLRHVGHELPHFPGSFADWIKENPQ